MQLASKFGRNMGEPLFVVVLGIDGAGKTAALRFLETYNLSVFTWRMVFELPEFYLHYKLPRTLSNRDLRSLLKPRTRAFGFLQFFSAEYEHLVAPALESGKTAVVDSYYYKQLAREELIGKSHPVVIRALQLLPPPDVVFYLHVDPRTAFRRKERISKNEVGGNALTEEAFCRFQTEVDRKLREYIAGYSIIEIDAETMHPKAIADLIIRNLIPDFDRAILAAPTA